MGMRALPDMYALCPQACVLRHTYQAKPKCSVLQLTCNSYQADSLYRAINHPSQYECSHWIYYICIHKIFDCGSAASTFRLCSVMMNGHITENFDYESLMF